MPFTLMKEEQHKRADNHSVQWFMAYLACQ